MTGRKSVIGLAVLCALALSAFASASASAAAGRAYTCTTTASSKNFSDEHCIVPTEPEKGTRGHVLIAEGTKTDIIATNAKTASSTTAAAPATLKGTLAGVKTDVSCTTVENDPEVTSYLLNGATSVSGRGRLVYSGCTVKEPVGKGCVVKNGKITTEELEATTAGQTANNKLEFKSVGANFAIIPIEGCANEAPPKANYPVTGSLVATTEGATTRTTIAAVETENKLKFGGNKAGIEGTITISMEGGQPIVLT
jgi:hypothetical protein